MISRNSGRTKQQTESLVVEINTLAVIGFLLLSRMDFRTGSHDGFFTISSVTLMGGIEDIGSDIFASRGRFLRDKVSPSNMTAIQTTQYIQVSLETLTR